MTFADISSEIEQRLKNALPESVAIEAVMFEDADVPKRAPFVLFAVTPDRIVSGESSAYLRKYANVEIIIAVKSKRSANESLIDAVNLADSVIDAIKNIIVVSAIETQSCNKSVTIISISSTAKYE